MKRHAPIVLTALSCLFLVTGCATITRGTTEALVIESTPAGADVEVSTGVKCKTPCSLEMKRKSNVTLDISKSGFDPVRVNVLSQIAAAGAAGMAGNVILGGLIGAGVDAASGATRQLTPNPVTVVLVPSQPAAVSRENGSPQDGKSDAPLEKARERCVAIGFEEKTEGFRSCVLDQLRNLSASRS